MSNRRGPPLSLIHVLMHGPSDLTATVIPILEPSRFDVIVTAEFSELVQKAASAAVVVILIRAADARAVVLTGTELHKHCPGTPLVVVTPFDRECAALAATLPLSSLIWTDEVEVLLRREIERASMIGVMEALAQYSERIPGLSLHLRAVLVGLFRTYRHPEAFVR